MQIQVWASSNGGMFSSNSLRNQIDDLLLPDTSNSSETLQNNLIPQKIGVFIWSAQRNRLPVRLELDKKGIDLDSVRCSMCDNALESIDHVLQQCSFANDVWCRFFRWWGLSYPIGISLNDLVQGGSFFQNDDVLKKVYQAAVWVCVYKIWQNRNNKIFRQKNCIAAMLIQEVQIKSFEWITIRLKKKSISWLQWLAKPSIYDDHG
ncbi:uncharacterized protein [Rutidosis leptorrhynchoides]|uniref:uncharacterized protein n=1 Tax=Rutidosis leptorrhynchoides TaxID=125765 RepID=UPI003A99ED88